MFPKRRINNIIMLLLIVNGAICVWYEIIVSNRDLINQLARNRLNNENEDDDVEYDLIDNSDVLEAERKVPFPYRYIIDEPNFCDVDVKVVNVIYVRSSDRSVRDDVRRTWGAESIVSSTGLRPLFLVGASQTYEEQQNLQNESHVHHDVIQVDLEDSYLNLTLKTLTALHWKQSRCDHVPWLLKSDADVFLNPWAVTKTLTEAQKDFVCLVLKQKHVCRETSRRCRDKRWVMSREAYPHDRYPPYCNGPAYALNQRAVRGINNAASFRKFHFPMEDIYFTGILAQGLDLYYHNIGTRMCLYHLKTPPHEMLALGKVLFVVDSFRRSGELYTHDDLWDHLNASRNK